MNKTIIQSLIGMLVVCLMAACSKKHESNVTEEEEEMQLELRADETTFDWKLEDDLLTLTKGERSINWLIHSIEDNKMTVGVQMRPDSDKRMYVVYQKKE